MKVTLTRFVRRADAEEAERRAIAEEDPVWNYQGRPAARYLAWMAAYPRDPEGPGGT
ncbi:hypothetical protein [Streptomyces sp. CA-111067]|uniref:hypothetical protein n=1 Tax=Streptomyces sp. CA-111067 TaxID=3240046 RepID=UPI003D974923